MGRHALHHFGDEPSRRRRQAHPQHVMAGGEEGVGEARCRPDDRQAVPGHRSPAVPGLLRPCARRRYEIGLGRVVQLLDPSGGDRRVVAGKLHHRAEPVAIGERRHADAVLGEEHRMNRAGIGAVHRHRIALSLFDRDRALELLGDPRAPAAEGEHVAIGSERPLRGGKRRHPSPRSLHPLEPAVLDESDAARDEPLRPTRHQSIGAEGGVAGIVIGTGEARFERRIEGRQGRPIEAHRGDAEMLGEEFVGLREGTHPPIRPQDIEQPSLLPLAVEPLVANEPPVFRDRGVEDLLEVNSHLEDLLVGAATGELPHPVPQGRVEPRLDPERSVGSEQRLERHAESARLGERQDMARTDVAAVAAGAGGADRPLINHRHAQAGRGEIMGAGYADHASADNDDVGAAGILWGVLGGGVARHGIVPRTIPVANGSPGWRMSVASPQT